MTPPPAERILVVESDPDVSDLIARQALQPLGYRVTVATDGATAIRQALQFQPDVILANLNLKGLSGKDLLVAFSSQGITMPVIVLAAQGDEPNVIQAFRLGAYDYLLLPARETEVVAVVERALKQMREGRARQQLDAQLKKTNAELQRRVRELTTIFSVGRAVISVTDQHVLFTKIVEAAMTVAEADMSWLTLKDERSKTFLLAAHRNLPNAWAQKVGQPLDDGVSTLVAMSAESLSISGDPVKKFKISAVGKSAMVMPIKVQNEVIGLLTVIRKNERAFGDGEQTLLEAIADYASISLVNARLFRALAQTAEAAQTGEKNKNEMLEAMRKQVRATMQTSLYPLELLLGGKMGPLTEEQQQALTSVHDSIKQLILQVNEHKTQPQKVR